MSLSPFEAELVKGLPVLKRQTRQLCRGNRADGDDLMQDTVERALIKRHLYTPETNMEAWLYTIARNLWREQLSRPKREIAQPALDIAVAPEQGHRINLLDTLRKLGPERARMLLVLIDCGGDQRYGRWHGDAYRMAADQLGISVGTLKSRVSRARASLVVCA